MISVTVNEQQYNCPPISAESGYELLNTIGGIMAARLAHSESDDIKTSLVIGALLSVGHETSEKVRSLVMQKVVKNGTDQVVSIRDFQGKQGELIELIALLVKENLQDFFDLVVRMKKEEERATEEKSQK